MSNPFIHKVTRSKRKGVDAFHVIVVDPIVSNHSVRISVETTHDCEFNQNIVDCDTPMDWRITVNARPLGAFNQRLRIRVRP
jgi:hypothetical protein